MNKRVDMIIEEARKLTPEEREELLTRLMVLGDPDAEAQGGPVSWGELARTRSAEVDSGAVAMVPWDDVLQELEIVSDVTWHP